MIRYRPHRYSLSDSVREEETFDSAEDMLSWLFDTCRKVITLTRDDLVIESSGRPNPMVGYRCEHRISLRRSPYICVGYCDMEV